MNECTYCQGRIQNRKTIIRFINVTQGINYLFCSRKCKKAWLSERIQKSQTDGEEWNSETIEIRPRKGGKTTEPKCEYLWQQFDDVKRCTHNKNSQPNLRLNGETPGFCTEDKCPLKPEPNKTFIEAIEENRKLLKAEYQRGYADGGANMNEKWVITMKEVLEKKNK